MKFRVRYARVHEMMIEDETIEAAQRRMRAMEAMWPPGELKMLSIYVDGAIVPPPPPPFVPKPKPPAKKPWLPPQWVWPTGWEPPPKKGA